MVKRVVLYTRCSTSNKDQRVEVQIEQLKAYCSSRDWKIEHEISDVGFSGGTDKRPGFKKLMILAKTRKIDVIVVTRLDRFFRSMNHMTTTLQELDDIGVAFISLNDQIDLTTASGRLMMHIISAFAEFEKNIIRDRTIAGLEYSRSKGIKLGRPVYPKRHLILDLRSKGFSYRDIAKELKCSMGVVSRAIAEEKSAPLKLPEKNEEK